MLARALADGLSLEGAGEALSVGGSTLFLRSQTGNPMDVHINTGANTRRYLLRQPELSLRIKLRALLIWNTGPEVLMAQRMLAPDVQPEAERVAALPWRAQDALLDEIEGLIGQPAGRRAAAQGQPRLLALDRRGQARRRPGPAVRQRRLRGRAALHRDSARSPAATTSPRCTRSSTTRPPTRSSTPPVPSLRWRHAVAAVQAAAISHGRIQDVYEHAADVMQFA